MTNGVAAVGFPVASPAAAVGGPELKADMREICEQAVDSGAFGPSRMIVDGEPFWGWDRLPTIDRLLTARSCGASNATLP